MKTSLYTEVEQREVDVLIPCGDDGHREILRIIGNARFDHNVCVMANNQYGMEEFGRLFYLLADLPDTKLMEYLDQIDLVRAGHRGCVRCSLKFLVFCQFFCGIQLPHRLEGYNREFDAMVSKWPGRDFVEEVWKSIDSAKPSASERSLPLERLRRMRLRVFPTEIRVFRGDFDK
jgi:hypothetical protein